MQAVADAKPLPHHGKALRKTEAPPPLPVQTLLDEKEALRESLSAEWTADDWLDSGDEPNFLRAGLSRQVLRKLRSGTWVIQHQLDLAKNSPLPNTFLLGVSYCGEGSPFLIYIPTVQAVKEGGYGADVNRCSFVAADAGERMINAAVASIKELMKGSRK